MRMAVQEAAFRQASSNQASSNIDNCQMAPYGSASRLLRKLIVSSTAWSSTHGQKRLLDLMGKLERDSFYDYKAERRRD
jgi:hypothetical protein